MKQFRVKISKKDETYILVLAENANQAIIMANQWLHRSGAPMVAHKPKEVKATSMA